MAIQPVILAAGCGKRMYSDLPKVLHHLAGRPLLERVIHTALSLSHHPLPIVIFGHQGELIREALLHQPVQWVEQSAQLGTGHALLQALPKIAFSDRVLVLYGDVPLVSESTLQHLIDTTAPSAIGLLTMHLANPTGYGRIKRNAQRRIISIVEEKDATVEERKLTEINSGIYLIPAQYLKIWLPQLSNQNAQHEYYLTDVIAFAAKEGVDIHAVQARAPEELFGVNDRIQLNYLERFYQRQQAEKYMRHGVTIADPARFDVRGDIHIGRDVYIDVNVILEGRVVIGDRCVIGPNVVLRDTTLTHDVTVKANSHIEGADIAAGCVIGPFARLRPDTVIKAGAHIGNFVEIKNSHIDKETKINHLSYIGDATIGQRVNIGAGTITCNYDGANKHKTTIGDDVHIGSDTQLVAPVTIGHGANIGAGSTIIKDAPAHQLTITHRLEQRSIADWKRPVKGE